MSDTEVDMDNKVLTVYLDENGEPVDKSVAVYARVITPKGTALMRLLKTGEKDANA